MLFSKVKIYCFMEACYILSEAGGYIMGASLTAKSPVFSTMSGAGYKRWG
jgi:hypothetical protein